jgi:predicted transporter
MRILGRLAVPLWLGAIGVIVMYAFFVTVADVSPGQVAGVTFVIAALAVLFAFRSVRVSSELSDRGGNPALRRARNRARERRGF